MKVVLINPPAQQTLVGNNPKFLDEERGYNPPLGILSIAAVLEQRSDHAVRVIDAQAEELSYDALAARLAQEAPDLIGITAMTFTLLDVVHTVQVARQAAPNARIVLGGPHVFLYPRESVALPGVDFALLGEAENTFLDLCDRLDQPDRWSEVPGLVYHLPSRGFPAESSRGFPAEPSRGFPHPREGNPDIPSRGRGSPREGGPGSPREGGPGSPREGGPGSPREGEIVQNPLPALIDDLDALPFPARHLVPVERYSSVIARRRPSTTMFTSRGCPYRCTFCDRPHLGKKFRARSAKSVVDEMEACLALGIHEFLLYDDTFTVRRPRVLDICSDIQRRGLDVGWDIRARVDTVDEEMLRALRAAGCERIHYGVEAGSDRFMEILRKGITVEDARKAFRATKRAGIATLAYFMIGIPGETEADIRQTMRLARELDPDFVHITILTPFPGTEIYRRALEEGVYERDFWLDFAQNPEPGFQPRYWTKELGRERLEALLIEAYKSFYTRPRYIARQLLKIRSWRELSAKIKAGLRVAFHK